MGAGPGGLCSAYVLSKAGVPTTVLEKPGVAPLREEMPELLGVKLPEIDCDVRIGIAGLPSWFCDSGYDFRALDPECQSLYRRFGSRPSDGPGEHHGATEGCRAPALRRRLVRVATRRGGDGSPPSSSS